MPFEIKKTKDGYKVCKKNNPKKCFSNKSLSLENAKKQMKAIAINEHKGSGKVKKNIDDILEILKNKHKIGGGKDQELLKEKEEEKEKIMGEGKKKKKEIDLEEINDFRQLSLEQLKKIVREHNELTHIKLTQTKKDLINDIEKHLYIENGKVYSLKQKKIK